MVDNIKSQQAYATSVMQKLPQPKKGREYTVKKGDNLWNIAKKELNKKNVSKQEISDYMLLIAKLNNMTTIERMNNLKTAEKIYMPQGVEATQKTQQVAKTQATQATAKSQIKTNSAEKSIKTLSNTLANDKSISIEKMFKGYPSDTDLYHIYNHKKIEGTYGPAMRHNLVTVTYNKKTGKIEAYSFDDQTKDIKKGKFDYEMDANGTIYHNELLKKKKAGQIDKAQQTELSNQVLTLIKSCK